MPVVRKIDKRMWEVRSNLKNKIARVLFTVIEQKLVLLHGFIKKTNKAPEQDKKIARERLAILLGRR